MGRVGRFGPTGWEIHKARAGGGRDDGWGGLSSVLFGCACARWACVCAGRERVRVWQQIRGGGHTAFCGAFAVKDGSPHTTD